MLGLKQKSGVELQTLDILMLSWIQILKVFSFCIMDSTYLAVLGLHTVTILSPYYVNIFYYQYQSPQLIFPGTFPIQDNNSAWGRDFVTIFVFVLVLLISFQCWC